VGTEKIVHSVTAVSDLKLISVYSLVDAISPGVP
jgi:hypothetical protein